MTHRTERQSQLPKFATEQEAAAFWDDHSPLDYPDDFQPIDVEVARPLIKRGLTVKLDHDTIEQLTTIAKQQGIGPSTLVRMWILKQLEAHRSPGAPSSGQ